MHWVKDGGRAGFRFQPRRTWTCSRMRLDHAMRQALECQFVAPASSLRWRSAVVASLVPRRCSAGATRCAARSRPPISSLAEQSGFIVPLGDWVLREAVMQAAEWLRQGRRHAYRRQRVGAAVPATQFIEGVAAALLQSADLPPGLLELELTESVLVGDADECLRRMRRWPAWAWRCPSTTSAPAIPAWPTSSVSHPTPPRSTAASSGGLPGDERRRHRQRHRSGGPGAQSAGHRRGCRARSAAGLPGPRWLPEFHRGYLAARHRWTAAEFGARAPAPRRRRRCAGLRLAGACQHVGLCDNDAGFPCSFDSNPPSPPMS